MTKKHFQYISGVSVVLVVLMGLVLVKVITKKPITNLAFENRDIIAKDDAIASDISISYPNFSDPKLAGLNNEILPYINKLKTEYLQQAQENKDAEKENKDYHAENSLYISYEPKRIDQSVISLVFSIQSYNGGAHPNTYLWTINYDLENKKDIAFSDLLAVSSSTMDRFSSLVVNKIETKNKAFGYEDDWVKEGAGPNPDNFQKFSVGTDSIEFYFDPYQVASYAEGIQEISVSKNELRDIK